MHTALKPIGFSIRFLLILLASPVGMAQLQAQFVTNGSATNQGNGCYQLTADQSGQAGSIFSVTQVDLTQPLNISARFNFGCKDANGADGIVFLFATTNTALGNGGGGLGYQGVSPSLAIEYDDYQNGEFGDPAADHVAIMSNGVVNHNSPNNLAGPIALPNIEDCNDHCFNLTWNPATQTLTATLDGTPISFTGNISNYLGGATSAYYGFTSGTGSLSNPHTVCIGPVQLQPMQDVDVCPSGSVQLQADPNGVNYQWAPHPTLSATNIANPIATPVQTTTYSVTIFYECGESATDDVTVNVLPSPTATASVNSPVCWGETIQLSAEGGQTYLWSGPGFASGFQNPSIPNADFLHSGVYTVTVTDAFGCTASASVNVVVFPQPVVAIVPLPLPLCENGPPQTLQAFPPGGVWGGAANASGQVDPAALGPGTFTATYTAVDANGCTGEASLQFVVEAVPDVTIFPAGPFCDTDPVQTLFASPPGGTWGGIANLQGQFDPAALGPGLYQVTYTFWQGSCFASDSTEVLIEPGTLADILPAGPFCPGDGLQTLSATPAGGVWGGAASATGQFNPAALGPGMHTVTYTYNVPGACAGFATEVIQVYCQPFASLSGAVILCEGETGQLEVLCGGTDGTGSNCFKGPYLLTYSIDGVAQPPVTISSSPYQLPVTMAGTYSIVNVTDGNGCSAAGTGTGSVLVAGVPLVSNLNISCNPTNTMYTVSFQISGGDPQTYSVSGPVPGTMTADPPYVFTSQEIPSGQAYSFVVNDANDCDPTTVAGSFSCQCETLAGTMNTAALSACEGQTVTAVHNGDEILDGDDALIFVLHSSNGNSLGTIFDSSNSPQFGLVPPMVPGVTYYISAVAGNSDGNGGVELGDPCLSVSFGTPVVFHPLPLGSIGQDQAICEGEAAVLTFSLSGNAPFDVVYSDGAQNFSLENVINNHSLSVSPSATTTYSLVSISDNSNPVCSTIGGNSVVLTVWYADTTWQDFAICQGDSLFLAGAFRQVAGTYEELLSTSQGCDSLVRSTLTVHALDTTYLFATSCSPANVGVSSEVLSDVNGCDSTLIRRVTFSTADTTYLSSTTCDPALAGVFSQTLLTAEGCDSVVVETRILLPSDTTYLSGGTCDPAAAGVFTTVLTNHYGCDSTLIQTVLLLPSDTTYLAYSSCDPANVGVFNQYLANQYGCDSLVVTTVSYSASDTTWLDGTTCDPAQAGVFTQNYLSWEGCDSVVITTINLLPSDTTFLLATSCHPQDTGVFTQVLTNWHGCDSTLITTTSLLPSDTTFLFDTTCYPQDTGQTVVILTNQYGCDSTLITQTSLLSADECGVQASLTGSAIPCGESLGSLTLTATLGLPPFAYSWSGPSAGSGSLGALGAPVEIDNLPAGFYSVTLTSANGLSTVLEAQVEQWSQPGVSLAATAVYNGFAISCAGAADGSVQATATGGLPPYQFAWSIGASSQDLSGLPAGSYQVTLTDAHQCTATGSILLNEPPPFSFSFAVNNLDCFGRKEGSIFVHPEGGVGPYRYSLAGAASQSYNAFTKLQPGFYEVTAMDANGCQDSTLIGIQAPAPVEVELGEDLFIQLGESTVLNAIVSLPYDSLTQITWTGLDSPGCPDCLHQTVTPLLTTTYAVSITAANGCQGRDELTVFVDRRKQIYVPNAFSPNGDGLNDVFMIFAQKDFVANIRSFLVFDRWGEAVFTYYNFQPNDPAYGWDGKYRGEHLNPGVFVWTAEVEFTDGAVIRYKGGVSLVR